MVLLLAVEAKEVEFSERGESKHDPTDSQGERTGDVDLNGEGSWDVVGDLMDGHSECEWECSDESSDDEEEASTGCHVKKGSICSSDIVK